VSLHASPLLTPERDLAAVRRHAGAKPRGGAAGKNPWLAADGSKRWGETFFLLYTPFWLTLCLGVVVPFKLYEVTRARARGPRRLLDLHFSDGDWILK
jgi:cycloeucalenol cycloisomerase